MVGSVTLYGIDQTVSIPHALACVAVIVRIDGLDRIQVGVRKVGHDIFWQVVHLVTNITGRHNQLD